MCDEKRSTRRLSAAGLALEWKETVKKLFDKVKIVARAPSESPTTHGEGQSVAVRDSMRDSACYRLSRITSGLLVGGVRPRRVTIFGYES